jgi:PQQ-dependent dehydrogenase (s-GDH family)
VTERTGKQVTRVNPDTGAKTVAVTIPEVFQNHGQDGLLGMALHSDLLKGRGNEYVYLFYTYDADPGPQVARRGKVRRYTYDAATHGLGSPVDLIVNLPAGSDHVSGRLIFGADQKLYLTIGDQGSNWLENYCNLIRSQELPSTAEVQQREWNRYQGKVLRVNLDGSVPSDNPVLDGVRSHIYTYGHRNAQGLAFTTANRLYASEHGPNSDDEVNLIEAGKNYGWPYVAGYNDDKAYAYANWSGSAPQPCSSLQFSGTVIPPSVPRQKESAWKHTDFRPPLQTFFTVAEGYDFEALGSATIAPGGLEAYTAKTGIPGWADSLLVLSLLKGVVYRVKLNGDGRSVDGEPKPYFKSTNRYRDIAAGPDNKTFYFATDSSGNSTDASGQRVRTLDNPGAIVAFTYTGSMGSSK